MRCISVCARCSAKKSDTVMGPVYCFSCSVSEAGGSSPSRPAASAMASSSRDYVSCGKTLNGACRTAFQLEV